MTSLYNISSTAMALLGTLSMTAMIFNTGCLIGSFTFHAEKKDKVTAVVFASLSVAVFQTMGDFSTEYHLHSGMGFISKAAGYLPAVLVLAVILFLIAAGMILFYHIDFRRKSVITENGIKETIDSLPDGLCFFEENGKTILTNTKMNMLSSVLTGHEVMDGKSFFNSLDHSEFIRGKVIRKEPGIYIELDDHTVWNFCLKKHQVKEDVLYELIAFNVTDQTELYRKLKEKNEIMEDVNRRLKDYSREMKLILAEKETLESKVRIHDSLGRILLATRTYLQYPEKHISRSELVRLWKMTTAVLQNEEDDGERKNLIKLLEEAAESLGVKIIIEGDMPEEWNAGHIFIHAMHECLTNTVRHGHGDELYCSFHDDGYHYTGEFRNNGEIPLEIKEGNGLHNLRKMVESSEGEMTVITGNEFAVKIKLVKGSAV